MTDELLDKRRRLDEFLFSLKSVAVAFSAGTDSTFLLKEAHRLLGDGAVAITAAGCMVAERELDSARRFCENEGVRLILITADTPQQGGFYYNPENRCYLCKRGIFTKIKDASQSVGIQYVLDGSNADDTKDYRPGMKAIKELGIISPLMYAGLTKSDIRELSREMGLDTWDKPPLACLATRFAFGEELSEQRLKMVEKAEQLLWDMGFSQLRVRVRENTARIEVPPDELQKAAANAEYIDSGLKALGFDYVSLDLGGYKTGNMNRKIKG